MSLGRRIAWNTIVQLVGKVITTIASLVIVALITRRLGVDGFGEYTTVIAYTNLFAVFSDLGVNVYLIKLLSQPGVDEEEEVAIASSLRVIGAAIVLTAGYFLTYLLSYSPLVRLGIGIGLIAIFAQTVNALYVSILQAKLEMQYAVITDIAGRLTVLAVTIGALALHKGVLWVVIGVAAGAILNMVVSAVFTARFVKLRYRWSLPGMKRILRAALPISITAILSFLYFKIDTVLLSTLHLDGGLNNTVEVGIYGAAYKVLDLLTVVPGIFVGNLFPIITTYLANKDERLTPLIQRAFVFLAAFSFPISAFLIFEPTKIITFIAGSSFAPGAVPLRILAFAVLVNFFSTIFTYTALALSRQRMLVIVYSVALVFNLVSNIILIPHYYYIAAASTTFCTEIIVLIGSYLICRRYINIELDIRPLLKLAAISAVLIAIMLVLTKLPLIPLFLILLAVYVPLLLASRVISPEDISRLMNRGVGS